MSKIKDLLAEEEGIDDLEPVLDYKSIAETVLEWSKGIQSEDYIADNAEFGLGDDDGEPAMFMENFSSLCDDLARENLDKLIEQEHLDLSDGEYSNALTHASDLIADYYSDYESALCDDAFSDYKRDSKYILDELKERNGQC